MLLMGNTGKPTISMAIFNRFLYVYQRVNLHFPMVSLWFPYGFPMVYQAVTGRGPRRVAHLDRVEAFGGNCGAAALAQNGPWLAEL